MPIVLTFADINHSFTHIRLFDMGTNNAQQTLRFSVNNEQYKVLLKITCNSTITFRPYYDQHHHLYDILSLSPIHNPELDAYMYNLHDILTKARSHKLGIELCIWELTKLDRIRDWLPYKWALRDHDYEYIE